MDKIISWFLIRDNVTFAIAVVGFFMSLYSTIKLTWQSRESYHIDVIDYVKGFERIVQLYICVTNHSSSPLAIKEILINGVRCELWPKAIRGKEDKWDFQSTPQFPLCIAPRHCQYAFIEFVSSELKDVSLKSGDKLCLKVQTSKKTEEKTILLGDTSHYLHPAKR